MSKEIREWILAACIGISAALFVRFFILETVKIDGSSMEPTFQNEDIILMEKVSYRFHSPIRNDIVIVDIGDKTIIKRVVGMPGDKLKIEDGVLYRNEEKVEEPYIQEKMVSDIQELTVPLHHVFVMGDNRNNSSDSRVYGAFDENQIQGRVMVEVKNNRGKWY